jgi:hypothetical protein
VKITIDMVNKITYTETNEFFLWCKWNSTCMKGGASEKLWQSPLHLWRLNHRYAHTRPCRTQSIVTRCDFYTPPGVVTKSGNTDEMGIMGWHWHLSRKQPGHISDDSPLHREKTRYFHHRIGVSINKCQFLQT